MTDAPSGAYVPLGDEEMAYLSRLAETVREATEDAARQQAGMREVALFRAANAQGVLGQSTLNLARRLRAADERIDAVREALDSVTTVDKSEMSERVEALFRACLALVASGDSSSAGASS